MLLGDEAIGQFVLIIGLAGKVGCEDLTAARYGFTKRVAGLIRFQTRGQYMNDLLPSSAVDLGGDAPVGENFDAVLQEGNQNENARVIARVVEPVFAERCEGEGMNGLSGAILRG